MPGYPEDRFASSVVAAFERGLDAIRARHPEIPHAVVTIEHRRGAHGLFGSSTWTLGSRTAGSIILTRSALVLEPSQTFGVLLHEAAHGLADARGLEDTSRQGRYHNAHFAQVARELGLTVSPRDELSGFGLTSLGKEAAARYEKEIAALAGHLRLVPKSNTVARLKAPPARVHVRCACGRRLRLLLSFLEDAPVLCGRCEAPFRQLLARQSGRTLRF